MIYNKLYLASASPRRRLLVQNLFKNIEHLDYYCEEPKAPKKGFVKIYLKECLDCKWEAAVKAAQKRRLKAGHALLVADTVVVQGREILGKPEDRKEARGMLRKLSGRSHKVLTSYRLGVWKAGQWYFQDHTEVTSVQFIKLNSSQIQNYVLGGEPMDKAGAYGFQGEGMRFIERVDGSYTNIVGLPLKALAQSIGKLRLK